MTMERNVGYLWFVASLMCVAGWVAELSSEHARAAEQDAAGATKVAARVVVARVNGQPIYEDQLKAETEKSLGHCEEWHAKGRRQHGQTAADEGVE